MHPIIITDQQIKDLTRKVGIHFGNGMKFEPIVRFIASELTKQPLSYRERQVFQMLGQGMTTRQIAERLNLSVKTIESWRGKIKEKRGLGNANQLVVAAAQFAMQEAV